jgi:hypothetical protein
MRILATVGARIEQGTGLAATLTEFVFEFLKSGMWEVLSIIGMTQILLLPVINRGVVSRVVAIILLPLLHMLVSWSFNYDFANGFPNWFNAYFGAHNNTVWDGGFFGPLAWSLPMLAGTLTYDLIASRTAPKAWGVILVASLGLMAGGYLTNCLSRLYDENPALQSLVDSTRTSLIASKTAAEEELESVKSEIQKLTPTDGAQAASSPELMALKQRERESEGKVKGYARKIDSLEKIAVDPVLPSLERLRNAKWGWADLPFVKPDREKQLVSYWLMDKKRMVSIPFTLFATGFGMFLYAVFIIVVDIGGLQFGVFRTLGQNPLAAYIIHEMLMRGFHGLAPDDSPIRWGLLVFAMFFVTVLLMVRYLEKHKLFLRL